jgi:hypothetical protein
MVSGLVRPSLGKFMPFDARQAHEGAQMATGVSARLTGRRGGLEWGSITSPLTCTRVRYAWRRYRRWRSLRRRWRRTPPAQAADAEPQGEEIIVTGFRASLDAALDVKRESVTAVDAIVAEDIAKFPDQNLAESLQRIPGVSIQRDARRRPRRSPCAASARSSHRVRLNGSRRRHLDDGASANRDRAFDFNVFASELFSSLVVHKTAEASLDEGSLGAVIDLNTGNPLRGKAGLTAVVSAQAAYNDLSENVGPAHRRHPLVEIDDGSFGVDLGRLSETDNARARQQLGALGPGTLRFGQRHALLLECHGTPEPGLYDAAPERRRLLSPERDLRSGRACLPSAHPALRRSAA